MKLYEKSNSPKDLRMPSDAPVWATGSVIYASLKR
jgi:hypothetical protein